MNNTFPKQASPGEKFEAHVDQEMLADLRTRLERTRFPETQAGPDWATGTPLDYAKRLRHYWLGEFDWSGWVARINSFEQRLVEVDGYKIHVVIEQGSGENPLPLVMTNGWPGSFLEFIDIIDALAHPERRGGSEADAFTIVIPSLPGYGFSPAPEAPVSTSDVARLWSKLMRQSFGFDRYTAYGSDWGSLVTATLAADHPEALRAILITTPGGAPYLGEDAPPFSDEELIWQTAMQQALAPESGYQALQGTKPQSLAYAHYDSPMALACWIAEKHQGWSMPTGSQDDPPMSMDFILANTMLYWINGALAPMWLYLFLAEAGAPASTKETAPVPAGFLFSPNDLMPPPPRSWLERRYDVAGYKVTDAGGHFPGVDNSPLLVSELQAFFRGYR